MSSMDFLKQLEEALGDDAKVPTTSDIFMVLCRLARRRPPPMESGMGMEVTSALMRELIGVSRQLLTQGADYYKPLPVRQVPDKPARGVCYLLGEPLSAIVFACPCGCGDTIWLPAGKDEKQRYLAGVDQDGEVAIHPSVVWKGKCASHFVISKSRVIWIY